MRTLLLTLLFLNGMVSTFGTIQAKDERKPPTLAQIDLFCNIVEGILESKPFDVEALASALHLSFSTAEREKLSKHARFNHLFFALREFALEDAVFFNRLLEAASIYYPNRRFNWDGVGDLLLEAIAMSYPNIMVTMIEQEKNAWKMVAARSLASSPDRRIYDIFVAKKLLTALAYSSEPMTLAEWQSLALTLSIVGRSEAVSYHILALANTFMNKLDASSPDNAAILSTLASMITTHTRFDRMLKTKMADAIFQRMLLILERDSAARREILKLLYEIRKEPYPSNKSIQTAESSIDDFIDGHAAWSDAELRGKLATLLPKLGILEDKTVSHYFSEMRRHLKGDAREHVIRLVLASDNPRLIDHAHTYLIDVEGCGGVFQANRPGNGL